MAKEKYGAAFVAGLKRNMAATGYVPPAKKVNIPLQTLKYLPGEMVETTKRWGRKLKKKLLGR